LEEGGNYFSEAKPGKKAGRRKQEKKGYRPGRGGKKGLFVAQVDEAEDNTGRKDQKKHFNEGRGGGGGDFIELHAPKGWSPEESSTKRRKNQEKKKKNR